MNEFARTCVVLTLAGGFVAGLSVALPASSHAGDTGVAVKVGGEADLDACGSVGEVYRLNPDGDNFLAVRAGPGSAHQMMDKLTSKTQVYMCDQNGAWVGIVYGPDGVDCGVSSPIAQRQSYAGTCASGWVHGRYIRLIAG